MKRQSTYNCLIIDDEIPLADSTAEYFNLFGVSAYAVYDTKGCMEFLQNYNADIILLDINLGESSGFELCQMLRSVTQVPILFISARQSDDDILLALSIGGDDYIRKPYTLSVLLAKVRAVLKRCTVQAEVYWDGRLKVDFEAGRAFVNGDSLKLKAMEYKLLCCLVRNKGKVLTKEDLFSQVWEDTFVGDGTLNVHIRHLREQIEPDPNHPSYIQTVWGTGYLFEEQDYAQ